MNILVVALAAAAGGAIRYQVDRWYPPVGIYAFPRSTFIVNALGSFLIGLSSTFSQQIALVAGVGFCGALTTFSGVALQLTKRIQAKDLVAAATYFLSLLLAAVSLAALGRWIGISF